MLYQLNILNQGDNIDINIVINNKGLITKYYPAILKIFEDKGEIKLYAESKDGSLKNTFVLGDIGEFT